jgi:hypothetical protein
VIGRIRHVWARETGFREKVDNVGRGTIVDDTTSCARQNVSRKQKEAYTLTRSNRQTFGKSWSAVDGSW